MLNRSSDINSKDFIKIFKKCAAGPCSLVNDAMLAWDNPLRLEKIFSIYDKIMTINDQIRDEKPQYDFIVRQNR